MRPLHALLESWYSAAFYRAAAFNWRGIGVMVLLPVLVIAWFPRALLWRSAAEDFRETQLPRIVAQLPTIQIKQGRMTTTPPGRHQIVDPATGRAFLILDDGATTLPATIDEGVIVITATQVGMRNPRTGDNQVWPLSDAGDRVITKEDAQAGGDRFAQIGPILAYAGAVGLSLVLRLLQALLYAAIGTLIASRRNSHLPFDALIRIAVVALVPVILLNTIEAVSGWNLPVLIWWPFCAAVAISYLTFGIEAASQPPAASAAP